MRTLDAINAAPSGLDGLAEYLRGLPSHARNRAWVALVVDAVATDFPTRPGPLALLDAALKVIAESEQADRQHEASTEGCDGGGEGSTSAVLRRMYKRSSAHSLYSDMAGMILDHEWHDPTEVLQRINPAWGDASIKSYRGRVMPYFRDDPRFEVRDGRRGIKGDCTMIRRRHAAVQDAPPEALADKQPVAPAPGGQHHSGEAPEVVAREQDSGDPPRMAVADERSEPQPLPGARTAHGGAEHR